MPNADYAESGMKQERGGKKRPVKKGGGAARFNEANVGWGGLPGKAQSGNRSGGTKKCKTYPVCKGL
jgi:hypothetical protein